MFKKKIVKVTVERFEGKTSECGKPQVFEGDTAISEAQNQMTRWSRSIPEGGGYDKCGFTVTYEDGEEYTGRYDLQYNGLDSNETIAAHMKNWLLFVAGERFPSWYTEENIESAKSIYGVDKEVAKEFLANYEIPA